MGSRYNTLISRLKSWYAVLYIGSLVIQLMLDRIDDYHGMTHCLSYLLRTSAFNGHVCDKVGHIAHLLLLSSLTQHLHAWVLWIGDRRIEVLELSQRRRCLQCAMTIRDDQHCVT